jgi:hypothetical protein
LTPASQALSVRVRHWIVDLMIGGSAALIAMTTANAALPPRNEPVAKLRPAPAAAQPVASALPEVLIAFTEPVPGQAIISPFGMRKLPWEEGGRLHEGVDIAAPSGAPVLAAADGVVVAAGVDGGYGRFVEVEHAEGLRSIYAHLGSIDPGVAPGAPVKIGVPIARIGSTGSSTGPHLHFEIRDPKGRPLNPSYFLDRAFAEADDLPLSSAARVPRGVRIAYVSRIPDSKKALMEAREAEKKGGKAKGKGGDESLDEVMAVLEARTDTITGRPRATVQTAPAAMAGRRALVAQIAAGQKAEMSASTSGADAAATAPSTPTKLALPAPAASAAPAPAEPAA